MYCLRLSTTSNDNCDRVNPAKIQYRRERDSIPLVMENPHARTVEEVIRHYNTDINFGLHDEQIEEFQELYGPNGELISCVLFIIINS